MNSYKESKSELYCMMRTGEEIFQRPIFRHKAFLVGLEVYQALRDLNETTRRFFLFKSWQKN